mgnify:CR=1 FL=1|tara:strand:+ start:6855 stop:7268 length:414 start_codon:yes stop_codon:yes gene_type:complete
MMIRKILFLILSSFFLAGCFAESMTLVQSGIGASQGRVIQSTISPVVSLSIKQTTGKFPIEHMVKREQQRIAKKASDIENAIIQNTKKKIEISKEKILPLKNNIENQVTKLSDNWFKAKTFAAKNFKHKPRFSYKVR